MPTVATPRLRPRDGGRDDVLAGRGAALKVGALAALATKTERDLVHAGRVVLGGHEPDAVLEADRVGVLAVEGQAAKIAGVGARCRRYSGLDQELLLLVRASGDKSPNFPPGPSLSDACILAHTLYNRKQQTGSFLRYLSEKGRVIVSLKELEKWLSTGQAAKALGLSRPSTIRRAEDGSIRAVRTAAGWLYDPESVRRFKEEGRTKA